MVFLRLATAAALLGSLAVAQLSGPVGPSTSIAAKRAKKTCNVLDFGAKPDGQTDLGPALTQAFGSCKTGGVIVVPKGNYALCTYVTLSGGSGWALQIDGIITRTGTAGGNMIFLQKASDVEVFSSTGKGAIQGNGYKVHGSGNLNGARIMRANKLDRFSIHDLALVDAPSFHLSLDTTTSGELYNLVIRGGNSGGLDGVDIWSNNIHVHDVMVTNKDECVTVKSPSKNVLIENIYCNWSGGCALGSLGADVDISNIVYRNVYTVHSNQMMMIKSNGGSGTVSNVTFDNFIGRSNAYSLNVDQYWSSMKPVSGDGVKLTDITFSNWKGTAANGQTRGTIQFKCADGAPCTGMVVENFNMWSEAGNTDTYTCRSAYGSGACLKQGSGGSYAAQKQVINRAPSRLNVPSLSDDLHNDFGTNSPIPIPDFPPTYFPGVAPLVPAAAASS